MLRLLSLLVEQQIALPEALRLTAAGVSDAYVASQCRVLAGRVERGTSLTLALIQLRSLPLSIVPLVYWGERHNLLADGLRSAAEMIEGRLNFRTDLLMQIIPPILFVFVGALAVSMVAGILLPMISMIQGWM
jgi:type II secretory pathway component PulF